MFIFDTDSVSWPMRLNSSLKCPGTSLHSYFLQWYVIPPYHDALPSVFHCGYSVFGIIPTTLLSSKMTSWIINKGLYVCFVWPGYIALKELWFVQMLLDTDLHAFFSLAEEFCMWCRNGDDCGAVDFILFSV